MEKILITAITFISLTVFAQPNFEWANALGSTGTDQGNSVTTDASGNVYITGSFIGTVDFDPGVGVSELISKGNSDVFIQKLSTSGDLLWVKSMGSTGFERGTSITIDTDGNVLTTGYFELTVDFDPGAGVENLSSSNTEVFVQKLDNNGNFIWAKGFGSPLSEDRGQSITTDANGNVFTTGYFRETADFDPGTGTMNLISKGDKDIFIQKLDANGNFIWAKAMGDVDVDTGSSITTDANGNVYTTGWFVGTVDFDPGMGFTNQISAGGSDVFIQKLDVNGDLIWAKRFGGIESELGFSISVSTSGNIFTGGHFQNTVDFNPNIDTEELTSNGNTDGFIQKLDVNGNFLWAKSFGGTNNDQLLSISIDDDENVYSTGYYQGTVDFDPDIGTVNYTSNGNRDIFIQKLDANGNFDWASSFGGVGNDYGLSMTVDFNGNVYTTGQFDGTVDFDSGTGVSNRTSNGGPDIFVLKLSQCSPTTSSTTHAACDSYLWNGTTYSTGGTYTYSTTNAAGCDSTATLDLTINNSSTSSTTHTACDSYLWNGTTYSTGGTYTYSTTNVAGCDSTATLILTINSSSTSNTTHTACDSYLWNGTTYSTGGTYTYSTTNAAGCDSTATLILTINSVDATVSVTNNTISANNTTADSYQWLDCNNGNASINGATNLTYTPISNGSYAVEITVGNCTEISSCEIISTIGLKEKVLASVRLYPNPVTTILTIDSEDAIEKIEVINMYGAIIQIENEKMFAVESLSPGVYFLNVHMNNGIAKLRFVKE